MFYIVFHRNMKESLIRKKDWELITPTSAYLPIFIQRILKLFDKENLHLNLVFLTFQPNPLSKLLKTPQKVIVRLLVFYSLSVFNIILRMGIEIVFLALLLLGPYLTAVSPIKQLRNFSQITSLVCTWLPKVRLVRTSELQLFSAAGCPSTHLIREGTTSQLKTNHEELIKPTALCSIICLETRGGKVSNQH